MPEFIQISIRAVFAYFSLVFIAKLMGKRQISQMNFFDYIVGLSLSGMAAYLVLDVSMNFLTVLPGILVFAVLQIITSWLSLKSKFVRSLFEGKRTPIIEKGKILEENMTKTRVNIDFIESMLREKNVFKLEDVEYAYLETSGKLSVMKKAEKEPLTPKDIDLTVKSSGVGQIIIEEGKINESLLRKLSLTKAWLLEELSSQGINDVSQVMFAQIDNNRKLYVDKYNDK